jgi:hypothetical protein
VRPRAAAAALTIVICGCGGGDPAPRPTATPGTPAERAEPTAAELIAALLEERAAALEAANPRAYAATATAAQRRRDLVHARRAARLELRTVQLSASSVDTRANRATARVLTSYSFRGVRGEFQVRRRISLRKRREWRITNVRYARGAPPWEVGDFVARRTRHFLVLAPGDLDVGDLPAALEDGYATMRDLLVRPRLQRRYLVLVTADAAQARALTTEIQGVETLTAISDATVVQGGPEASVERVLSLRLLVVWQAYAALAPAERAKVVTHELTHAVLAGATSGRTPSWLGEGIALYVSSDRRPAPPEADLVALSKPDTIARLAGTSQASAYATSSAAAFAIADRFGRRKLLKLYDVFNEPSLRGRPGPRLTNRAVRRVLGISLAEVLG